ncbi:unnamed protein product [Symbiodinium microadriaticum]|nr:unnamed protein product [Symbiodinium microadriaticum]
MDDIYADVVLLAKSSKRAVKVEKAHDDMNPTTGRVDGDVVMSSSSAVSMPVDRLSVTKRKRKGEYQPACPAMTKCQHYDIDDQDIDDDCDFVVGYSDDEDGGGGGDGEYIQQAGSSGSVLSEFTLAQPGEAAELTLFAVQSNQDAYHTRVCTEEEACRLLAVEEEQIRHGLVEKIITDNGSLIGFYSLKSLRESDQSMEIGHIFVDSQHVKLGFGKILFERATESAFHRGATKVHFISDPGAVGFYLKLGAKKTGEDANFLNPEVNVSWMQYII